MKIAIDATGLVSPNPTGVEIATRDLILALLSLDAKNQYLLYVPEPLPAGYKFNLNVEVKVLKKRALWTWRALGAALKKDKPDLFWSPANRLPPNLPPKVLATSHDLGYLKFPQAYTFKQRLLQKLAYTRAKNFATKIIAVSEATKRDFLEFSKIDPHKVEVIYHALPSTKARYAPGEQPLALPDEFILSVGRVEPRKNPHNIIQAFAEALPKHPNLHLVFAGPKAYEFEKIQKLVQALGLEDRVHFLGFVSPANLSQLYHETKILLYPSLWEGFGFPILEGFSSRVPVITSNVGALAEVAGDAAYLVDPHHPAQISEAIDRLLTDYALRSKHITAGEARLKDFSWTKSAEKLLKVINSLK